MLAILSFRNNSTERCNPGHQTLAKRMGAHMNTARRCMVEAERIGVLVVVRSIGGYSKTTQATNQYSFNLDAIKSYDRATNLVPLPNCDPYQNGSTGLPNWSERATKKGSKPLIEPLKEPKDRQTLPPLPESLNTGTFPAQWEAFVQHRIKKKKPLTDLACSRLFALCEEWGPAEASKAIDTAIISGWTGLFKPKPEYVNGKPPPQVGPVTTGRMGGNGLQRAEF